MLRQKMNFFETFIKHVIIILFKLYTNNKGNTQQKQIIIIIINLKFRLSLILVDTVAVYAYIPMYLSNKLLSFLCHLFRLDYHVTLIGVVILHFIVC